MRVSPPTHTASPTRLTCTRPRAADGGALRRDVLLGEDGAGQPLAEAGVEAAGDRVLVEVVERADLDVRVAAAVAPQPGHADVEPLELVAVGAQREHGAGVVEQDADPAGAVVAPLRVPDVGGADAEGVGDLAQDGRLDRAVLDQRRGLELQALARG